MQQYWCCPVLLTIIVKIGRSLCSAVMNMSLMTLLLSLPDSCQDISFNEIHTMLILLQQDVGEA